MGKFLGGFITKTAVTISTTSASGIWPLNLAMQYRKAGSWPLPSLYAFTSFTFTNGGQTGSTGPSLATLTSNYDTTTYSWLTNTAYFNATSGIQLWTVPKTGTYTIDAYGAAGGQGESSLGYGKPIRIGLGAQIRGEFSLTQGDKLKILIGQKGLNGGPSSNYGGGGGGGTYVTTEAGVAMIVAAGGNGENWGAWNTQGPNGLTTNNTVATGTNGGAGNRGGGGGGFVGNGQDSNNAIGGKSFANGGAGGAGTNTGGAGGFGGGGGSLYEGGGGGGYSGGKVVDVNAYDSSFPSYGAGSYNTGSNPYTLGGARNTHGQVIITFVG